MTEFIFDFSYFSFITDELMIEFTFCYFCFSFMVGKHLFMGYRLLSNYFLDVVETTFCSYKKKINSNGS